MKKILAILFLLGIVTNVSATLYDFTSDIGSYVKVSGSFEGTQNGNLVENITNISVSYLNLTYSTPRLFEFSEPFYALGYDENLLTWTQSTAVASFDGFENNFAFVEGLPIASSYDTYGAGSAFADYALGANRYVSIRDTGLPQQLSSGTSFMNNGYSDPTNWTLAVASVPESSSIYLFAFGMLGLFGVARKNLKGVMK